jgi:hypothetical protein
LACDKLRIDDWYNALTTQHAGFITKHRLLRHLYAEYGALVGAFNSIICDQVLLDAAVELGPSLIALGYMLYTRDADPQNVTVFRERSDPGRARMKLAHDVKYSLKQMKLALENRYNASFPLTELPDINMEFKGGIQHILTAIDGLIAYGLSSIEDPEDVRKSWIRLTGFSVIGENNQGTVYPLTIGAAVHHNMIEMFQPEWLVSIFHELFHCIAQLPEMHSISILLHVYDKIAKVPLRKKKLIETIYSLEHTIDKQFSEDLSKIADRLTEGLSLLYPGGSNDLFLEDIMADIMCRDVCFGQNGNNTYRKYYGMFYAATLKHQRFIPEIQKDELCWSMLLRYLLTLAEPPTKEHLSCLDNFRRRYKDEILECHPWFGGAIPSGLIEGTDEAWERLWCNFSYLDSTRDIPSDSLYAPIVHDALVVFIKDHKGKVPFTLEDINENKYPSVIDIIAFLRKYLWSKINIAACPDFTASADKGGVKYMPEDAVVGSLPHEVVGYDAIAYARDILTRYLEYIYPPNRIDVLYRDDLGNPQFLDNTTSFQVDPAGGTFSSDVPFRRQYFKARVSCLFSLWDLGLLEKRNKILNLKHFAAENELTKEFWPTRAHG